MMNETKGNMYGFITHTWNPIKGKCSHDCSYCYMKIFPIGKLRLDNKSLTEDLGENNFIFVGSGTDMFAENVPDEWIAKVLKYCRKFDNKYLFQTKNPFKFWKFIEMHPKKCVLGTTIETNRAYEFSKAPSVLERSKWLQNNIIPTMITIEPIMDFDLPELIYLIEQAKPDWVNIGADSKSHNLPEPSKEKILELVIELKKFTEVKIKTNLRRIVGDEL